MRERDDKKERGIKESDKFSERGREREEEIQYERKRETKRKTIVQTKKKFRSTTFLYLFIILFCVSSDCFDFFLEAIL